MATITKPYTFASGAIIYAAEHNDNFDTIYTDYNGNVTNANIAAAAAIALSKLAALTASRAVVTTAGGVLTVAGGNLTLAADLTTSGANALTLTTTGATNVTLPTTGTLATLAGAETLSNKTLTAPKLANGGFIADANGNEGIILTTTASAVNEITVVPAATGNDPAITASGGDTNIDLALTPKGEGGVQLNTSATAKQSTISSGLVVNNGGNGNAADDFNAKGDTDAGLLYVDASTDTVGVGTATPTVAKFTINGSIKLKRTAVSDTAYTALVTDHIIAYTALTAGRTVTLPAAATTGASANPFVLIVKDEAGAAGTSNITIDGSGAETIDGAATNVINTNYGSRSIYCNGTAWFTF